MIDSYFRQKYQKKFVNPVIGKMVKWKVKPHVITLGALLIGILIVPLLAYGYAIGALIALAFSGYLDTLDGSFARATNQVSEKGAVLDIVSDRMVEFAIVFGLYLVDPFDRGLTCLLMLGSILVCVTSFLIVGMFIENDSNKSFHYNPGLMERSEAFFLFGLMILFPFYFDFIGALFAFLVLVTGLWRVMQFQRHP